MCVWERVSKVGHGFSRVCLACVPFACSQPHAWRVILWRRALEAFPLAWIFIRLLGKSRKIKYSFSFRQIYPLNTADLFCPRFLTLTSLFDSSCMWTGLLLDISVYLGLLGLVLSVLAIIIVSNTKLTTLNNDQGTLQSCHKVMQGKKHLDRF